MELRCEGVEGVPRDRTLLTSSSARPGAWHRTVSKLPHRSAPIALYMWPFCCSCSPPPPMPAPLFSERRPRCMLLLCGAESLDKMRRDSDSGGGCGAFTADGVALADEATFAVAALPAHASRQQPVVRAATEQTESVEALSRRPRGVRRSEAADKGGPVGRCEATLSSAA